jgi:hypothetical protein
MRNTPSQPSLARVLHTHIPHPPTPIKEEEEEKKGIKFFFPSPLE